MISFRVKRFDQLSVRAAADKLFVDFLVHLPKSVKERLYGTSGRFIWVPDPKGGSFSELDVLDDVRNRGPLFKKIMQELIDESEEV